MTNWRDNPENLALLKKGVTQYEVATLTLGRDFSWCGPFDSLAAAERQREELNAGSMRSQVLVIPEESK